MKETIKGKLIKDKGENVGQCGFFITQYENQDMSTDPWLDGVIVNFYKWLRDSRFIIVEMQLYGVWNDQTKATFKYPDNYITQVVFPLNGLTHKEFYEKYKNDLAFMDKNMKFLASDIEPYKDDIENYRQNAKIISNN